MTTTSIPSLEREVFEQVRDMALADRGRLRAEFIAWAREYARNRLYAHRLSAREALLVDGAVDAGIGAAHEAWEAKSKVGGA